MQRAVTETGYVPNRAARSLVTGRTYSVALVVSADDTSAFDDPFLGHALRRPVLRPHRQRRAARTSGRAHVHMVLMQVSSTDVPRPAADLPAPGRHRRRHADLDVRAAIRCPRLLVDAGVAAVLFARPADAAADQLRRRGLSRPAPRSPPTTCVARGCRSIVTISGPLDTPAGADRLAGFREAMARHGRPFVPAVEGNFTQEGGEAAMLQLLADVPDARRRVRGQRPDGARRRARAARPRPAGARTTSP